LHILLYRQKSGFKRQENNRLYRFFRLFLVGIRYFPVFKIPKSVSVSVFKNIRYLLGFSVNRPTSIRKIIVKCSARRAMVKSYSLANPEVE